eukprot:TRINITY_DN12265_c0_g1_i1.p1 TRINITY_DN12265_c0_g1~~TRINITY_DN12265_c0_g1_i1.p1  ORF type:complete len:346 (+),score=73.58 TRINITY_DN12265_c0_g1_i1:74-1111(+)
MQDKLITTFSYPEEHPELYISGSWDNWLQKHQLVFDPVFGTSLVDIPLLPGLYQYKYIIDGEWVHRDGNDVLVNDLGTYDNVVFVGGDFELPYTFEWIGDANQVQLVLDYDWNDRTEMIKDVIDGQTIFSCYIDLPLGTFFYKYIVDGEWTTRSDLATKADKEGNINNYVEIRPGVQFPHIFNSDEKLLRYYLYLPNNYEEQLIEDTMTSGVPLLVYLHGSNVGSMKELENVDVPKLANEKLLPFIAVSPMLKEGTSAVSVVELIDYVCNSFAVDHSKLYLLEYGNSELLWNVIQDYSDYFTSISCVSGNNDSGTVDGVGVSDAILNFYGNIGDAIDAIQMSIFD